MFLLRRFFVRLSAVLGNDPFLPKLWMNDEFQLIILRMVTMTVDSIRDAGPLDPASLDALSRRQFRRRHASIHRTMSTDAQGGVTWQMLRVLVVNGQSRSPDRLRVELTRQLGCTALHAKDGFAAVRVAVDYQPNVVLLDFGLTLLDSCQIARHLRFDFPRKDVWIIAVTGRIDDERRNKSADAGIDVLLTEPLELAVFEMLLVLECGRVNRATRDDAAALDCQEQLARSTSLMEH